MIVSILLITANLLGAGMIVPQAIKLRRHRVTDGVSGPGIGVGIALNLWWGLYGVSQSLWALLPLSAASVALYFLLAFQFVSILGSPGVRSVARGLSALGWPLAGLVVAGWTGVGLALGVAYCVQFTPAVVETLRTNHLGGLSVSTWVMAGIEGAIWFYYGQSHGDIALTLGGGGGALMSLIVITRVVASNHAGSTPPGRLDLNAGGLHRHRMGHTRWHRPKH